MHPRRSLRSLIRSLAQLAAPVALARLGIMGMGIADTIVVGQLAPADLPAFALGWAPTGVLIVTGIGLLLGVQVLTARAIGEGRPRDAGAVWRRGLVIGLFAGILSAVGSAFLVEPMLIAFGIEAMLAAGAADVAAVLGLSLALHFCYVCCAFFVEAVHRPIPGTVVIWAANLVNLALNLLLVPSLGAIGSAWATVGGRAFMFFTLAGWIVLSATGRTYGVREHAPHSPSYRALLGVGAAAAVSQLAEAGAFSALTVIAGRLGAEAVAAYQLLLNTLAVVFMISLGVAAATAVVVSETWGSRNAAEASRVGWVGLAMNSAAMLVCVAVLMAFPSLIANALTSDASLAALVASLMPLAALMLVPDGGQVVVASALRARGDNWLPTASHVLAYVVVMPPLAWWLGEHLGRGVAGLMESIVVASFVSVAVLMWRLQRLSRA
ncbi:MAG: MATE family efflux transporter [Candidatus Binatia bacterium]